MTPRPRVLPYGSWPTRITSEPRLLARARHSHIVEVLWHSTIHDGGFARRPRPWRAALSRWEMCARASPPKGKPSSSLLLNAARLASCAAKVSVISSSMSINSP